MGGFSPEWLALREPADHAARAPDVARAVKSAFAGRKSLEIVDLGCGAGSNLRGTYDLYPNLQRWTLVDHDEKLLRAAHGRLVAWADRCVCADGDLELKKGGATLHVRFRQADLSRGVGGALDPTTELVTSAALFDLCSTAWIEGMAATLKSRRLPLYTVLTYDGRDRFEPPHPLDGAMLAAFHADMRRDKGFGPAAGPDAARALVRSFEAQGYRVASGDSPWVLPTEDRLARDLATGFVAAVEAGGRVEPDNCALWRELRLAPGGVWETGHTDVFAAVG